MFLKAEGAYKSSSDSRNVIYQFLILHRHLSLHPLPSFHGCVPRLYPHSQGSLKMTSSVRTLHLGTALRFGLVWFLRLGFSVHPWTCVLHSRVRSWNLLRRLGWPQATCRCLLSPGIKGLRHHCLLGHSVKTGLSASVKGQSWILIESFSACLGCPCRGKRLLEALAGKLPQHTMTPTTPTFILLPKGPRKCHLQEALPCILAISYLRSHYG